jgi:hypothetical protein
MAKRILEWSYRRASDRRLGTYRFGAARQGLRSQQAESQQRQQQEPSARHRQAKPSADPRGGVEWRQLSAEQLRDELGEFDRRELDVLGFLELSA